MTRIRARARRQDGRRLRRAVLAVLLILPALFVLRTDVGAVHDTGAFELEGDAVKQTDDDWDNVCYEAEGANAAAAVTCGTNVPTDGAIAVAWESEPALNSTIFTGGGSKDPEDISAWAWKDEAGGLPDKDNLLHAFAARYSLPPDSDTCPAGDAATCEVIYFGSDRYANDGDAHQAFWFLQKEIGLGDNKIGGGFGFSFEGDTGHVNGDLLVISEFSNGGSTSTIKVLEWDTTCTKAGGGCESANLRTLAVAEDALCEAALSSDDAFCGVVNPTDGTTAPWPYTDKKGNDTYLQGEFFEAGVNLSLLGLADTCFSSVVSETRSSTSATATLKDFVLGGFGHCGSELTTTPSDNAGTAIPSGGISIGTGSVQVRDSAVLDVTGVQTWSGTLQFSLCGPLATTGTPLPTCASGGAAIGSAINVNQSTTQPILSAAATVTSAGRYCWRGDFTSATSGLADASDSSLTECFIVNPVTPSLSTQAVDSAGANVTTAVPFGTALFDKATLGGTAAQPGSNGPNATYPTINPTVNGAAAGGTITFSLFGPGISNCNNLAAGFAAAHPSGIVVNVSGNGNYTTPTGFTPSAAGDYYWKATYSGSSPNTNGASHNGDCLDSNEKVTVLQLNPSISTVQSFVPNDSATITVGSGAGDLAGSVVFKMWVDDATCTGAPDYASGSISIATGTGTGLSRTVVSANTTAYGTTGTTFHWVVEYTSTNNAHTNVTSACGVEHSSITVQNAGTANT